MTAIKVEKNVPIPGKGAGRPLKLPLDRMEINDSIFIKCTDARDRGRATALANAYARKHGVKFTTRTVDGGLRIWRIANTQKELSMARVA